MKKRQTETEMLLVSGSTELNGGSKPIDRRVIINFALILPAVLLVVLVVLYPIVISAWLSVTGTDNSGVNPYVWIVENPIYIGILLRTIGTALLTVIIALALSYPFAYLLVQVSATTRSFLFALVLIPFWVSGLVRTFAWVIILQPNGVLDTMIPFEWAGTLLRTPIAVEIGMVQVLLPFMIIPIFNSMKSIDMRLIAAGNSLGASPVITFWKIFFPLSLPGVFAGAQIVLMLSVGFYIIPQMLGSPQESLLGQAIFVQASSIGNLGRAGALSITLLFGAVACLLPLAYLKNILIHSRGTRK